MAWPELSIEDFPPRRDDEPSSLRQDIIDELSDHFACALNRELLRNPNEKIARQRVLNQFGDPIKIARQLWLEAMKERIMSQRILTGVSVMMAVCGFIVVGLVWSMMKESQAFNSRMMAQMEEIADRPVALAKSEVDQQILKQLKQLNQTQGAQSTSNTNEMSQISFELIKADSKRKPASGFKGKLIKSGDQTDSFVVEAESDESGKLDFGRLPWGKYSLSLQSPWGEHNFNWEASGTGTAFTTIPGRDYTRTIVCPAAAPEAVPVQFKVEWPEHLKAKDCFLLCDFRNWLSPSASSQVQFKSARMIENDTWYYVRDQKTQPSGVYLIDQKNQVVACPLSKDEKLIDISLNSLNISPSIDLRQGHYDMFLFYLIHKNDLARLSALNKYEYGKILVPRTKVLSTFTQLRYRNYGTPFNSPTTFIVPFLNESLISLEKEPGKFNSLSEYANGIVLPDRISFSADQNQKNVWQIKVPELDQLKIPEDVKQPVGNTAGGGFF